MSHKVLLLLYCYFSQIRKLKKWENIDRARKIITSPSVLPEILNSGKKWEENIVFLSIKDIYHAPN